MGTCGNLGCTQVTAYQVGCQWVRISDVQDILHSNVERYCTRMNLLILLYHRFRFSRPKELLLSGSRYFLATVAWYGDEMGKMLNGDEMKTQLLSYSSSGPRDSLRTCIMPPKIQIVFERKRWPNLSCCCCWLSQLVKAPLIFLFSSVCLTNASVNSLIFSSCSPSWSFCNEEAHKMRLGFTRGTTSASGCASFGGDAYTIRKWTRDLRTVQKFANAYQRKETEK